MASVNDIIAVTWHQRLGSACFSNRRYFRILDIGGEPYGHKAALDDLVEQFWNSVRQICAPEWILTTGKLVNLTEIHDISATGRYDFAGDPWAGAPFAFPFPTDPRTSLRWTIWGREEPGEPVITNGLYLSGINQWLAVNGHWNSLVLTEPLTDLLKLDNSSVFSPWILRPVCITGDTQHLRESSFVDVRDAECNPNVRLLMRRKLKGGRNPTPYVYP